LAFGFFFACSSADFRSSISFLGSTLASNIKDSACVVTFPAFPTFTFVS